MEDREATIKEACLGLHKHIMSMTHEHQLTIVEILGIIESLKSVIIYHQQKLAEAQSEEESK